MRGEPLAPGVIDANQVYTVAEFRRRTGLGDFTWRQVRTALQIKVGRKRYVRGCDWIKYLEQFADQAGSDREEGQERR